MPGGLGVDRVATERLAGRRPEAGDAAAWTRWYTDPRIDEEAWPEHLRTADVAQEDLDDSIRHWERWGFGPWTVLDRGGEPVGVIGLSHTTTPGRPGVEITWFVDPDRWGRGYATEMAREAIRVAFEVLELDELWALATPANGASLRVMDKLGFDPAGRIEHAGLPHELRRLGRPA